MFYAYFEKTQVMTNVVKVGEKQTRFLVPTQINHETYFLSQIFLLSLLISSFSYDYKERKIKVYLISKLHFSCRDIQIYM